MLGFTLLANGCQSHVQKQVVVELIVFDVELIVFDVDELGELIARFIPSVAGIDDVALLIGSRIVCFAPPGHLLALV